MWAAKALVLCVQDVLIANKATQHIQELEELSETEPPAGLRSVYIHSEGEIYSTLI